IDREAVWPTENGAGGCEHDLSDSDIDHGIEKIEAVGDVVQKIFRRILHRFANERTGGKVHDRIWSSFRQSLLERLSILQIAFDKFSARIDCAAMTLAQVIEDRDAMAFIKQ